MAGPDKPSLDDLRIDHSSHRSRGGFVWWIVLFVVVAGIGFVAVQRGGRPVPVTTAPVVEESPAGGSSKAPAATVLNASGYVTARRRATVSSKSTGRIVEVLIEEGMRVKEGQVLARLDASNIETSVALAQAQLDVAKSALAETRVLREEAGREFERVRRLVDEGVASPSEFDRAEANAMSLDARLFRQEADVGVSEKQLLLYRQQLDDLTIRAPFDGVVVTKNAQPGEMISPLSAGGAFTRTGICTIVDMSSLEIEVDVNEAFINRVAAGQPVSATLDAYPDWSIPCRVIAIVPTADRQKATVRVRVGFNELDPRILPDMGIKVAFQEAVSQPAGEETQPRRRLTIPKDAVRTHEGDTVVFVLKEGRAVRKTVVVSSRLNDRAVIGTGLVAGEAVIVSAPEALQDGQRVQTTNP